MWDRTKGRPEPVHLLDRVPLFENNDPMVALSEASPGVVVMRPQTIPYVRQRVAEMLNEANKILHPFKLGVTDAWRPFSRQVRIYEFIMDCAREKWPHREYASLKRTVNRWVAPIDRKAPPGHCTGAAVDVVLLNAEGKEMDVFSPYSRHRAAPTFTLGLTTEAQENRTRLVEAMLEVGFSNCRDEWWHYSYGDSGWAVRLDKPQCFYGLAELPLELYAEQERLAEIAIRERPNPFIHG